MQERRNGWVATSLVFMVTLGLMVCGCAAVKSAPSGESASLKITDVTVERLNDIAKEKYHKTDVLVFRTTFNFMNPGSGMVQVSDLSFEVKVDDGTPQKTIVQSASMPTTYIPGNEDFTWTYTAPLSYGGMIASYILRGMGTGGIKGAVGKLNEVWKALGNDEKRFYIKGRFAKSYPDRPEAGKKVQQFAFEYEIPEL